MSNSIDRGVIYGASAYVTWGIIPIFWKFLGHVSAVEIVTHRIVWTLVFALAALAAWERLPKLWSALRSPRTVVALVVSALLIALNWGLFIWAVTTDRIIDTSPGTTSIRSSVSCSAWSARERLTKIQIAAIGLAVLA
jgi:chloramphenicol-sensitive protein RarD